MPLVPTFPTTTTVDKRVRVSALQRVDLDDFNGFTSLERAALAHLFWRVFEDGTYVIEGMRVQGNDAAGEGADDLHVWVQAGSAVDRGYLARHPTKVQFAVPPNSSGVSRWDRIGFRYVEEESDSTARRQLSAITRTTVTDIVVGVGNGTTTIYDLAHSGVDNRTLTVKVGGQLVAVTLAAGTGGGGVDQLVFPAPPGNGLTVTASYVWQAGGVEQPANLNTRFTAGVEFEYAAGVALSAGFTILAQFEVPDGAVAITGGYLTSPEGAGVDDGIGDERVFFLGARDLRIHDALGARPYGVLGENCGVDITPSGGEPPDFPVRVWASGTYVINGVTARTGWAFLLGPGPSVIPVAADALEDGLSLVNGTAYYVYACLNRSTSPPTVDLVLTTKQRDNSFPANCLSAILKDARYRLNSETLYLGHLYYIDNVWGFRKQRRLGDYVAFTQQIQLASLDNTDFGGGSNPREYDLKALKYVPWRAKGVRLWVTLTAQAAGGNAIRVSAKMAGGLESPSPTELRQGYDSSELYTCAEVTLPFSDDEKILLTLDDPAVACEVQVFILGYIDPIQRG